jgi:hypothetical protein
MWGWCSRHAAARGAATAKILVAAAGGGNGGAAGCVAEVMAVLPTVWRRSAGRGDDEDQLRVVGK